MLRRKFKARLRKVPVNPELRLAEIEVELENVHNEIREKEKNDPYLDTDPATSWTNFCKYMKPEWDRQAKLDREKRLLIIPEFNREVKGSDHVMSLEDFIEHCEDGMFIDYDGFGHYVKDGKMSNIDIYPSDVEHNSIRKDFDTIVWFNK